MIKVPRLNKKVKKSIFCVDDCIATFSEENKLIYQAMYLDELDIDVREIGQEYKIYFSENMNENLEKYGGILIERIEPSEKMLDDIEQALDLQKVIMLEIKGIECPWDWRYQKIDWGNHTFLLMGRHKNIFTGIDPYYEIEHVELSKKQLMRGYVQARILTKGMPDDKNLFKDAKNKVRTIQDISCKFELLKKCIDFQNINKNRQKIINEQSFDDFSIENNELIQSLQNCEYSRLRFSIFLLYLKEINYSLLLEKCIKIYMDIANTWEIVRNLVIKTLVSGIDNNKKIGMLLEDICEMEETAIKDLNRYFLNY